MRTKFLFYTDPHATATAPRHRIDDYTKAIIEKLRESYQLAMAEGCSFIAMGGDLFNSHRIYSYDLLNDLMDVMCLSGLTTYAVVGQHDIHAYNPDTFKTSALAFISRHCASLKIIWKPEDVPGTDVTLYPSHVWDKIEDAKKTTVDSSRVNILVAHHLLYAGKKMFDTIPTSELGGGPYDLVLSGDLHCGFETHEVGGTWFCNPGALVRRNIDEIDRQVQVAVVEVEKGSIPIVEMRSLKSVKPGKEVFGQDFIETVARPVQHADPTAFVTSIEEFDAKSVDVHELVQNVGKAQGISNEVLVYLASKKGAIIPSGSGNSPDQP